MPFYEYECENCKFYVELLQKVSDEPLKKCPSCKKNTIKKLVSAPVFRLKGSGWYETDFKGDKENKRNLAVEKEAESSSSEDSKPAKAASDAKAADAKAGDAKPAAETPAKASESKTASGSGSRKPAAKSSRAPAKPAAKAKPKAKAKAAARGRRR